MVEDSVNNEQYFVVLEKDNPTAWAMMPHAIKRIKKFCDEHGSDLNPDVVAKAIQNNFVSDDPLMLVIVGYQKGVGVFCHALGVIEDVTGNRILTIVQFKTDIPFVDREQVARMWKVFEKFGLAHGAKEAQLVTENEKLVRVFENRYGFKLKRYLMRKELREE